MFVTLWIVFACLSIGVESKYRFRFHTCIKEDQKILESENLISFRQIAFISDGALVYNSAEKSKEAGIKIHHGAALKGVLDQLKPGLESSTFVITIDGSQFYTVINFWSHAYYFVKKSEETTIDGPKKTMKPSLDHFIRVYFICAPGNSRSALVLFGEQAKPRRSARSADEEHHVAKRAIRNSAGKTPAEDEKNAERVGWRTSLRRQLIVTFVHFGFGIAMAINGFVLLVSFLKFRTSNPVETKEKTSGRENKGV